MKKEELKRGMIIETRCGSKLLVVNDSDNDKSFFDLTINCYHHLTLDENLLNKHNNECDIVKVYKDYTCSELIWERPKELLTQEEKDYLKVVIMPFKDKVESIMRYVNFTENEYIEITFKKDDSDGLILPYIKNMTLKFKGLEAKKEYTLKELGLED